MSEITNAPENKIKEIFKLSTIVILGVVMMFVAVGSLISNIPPVSAQDQQNTTGSNTITDTSKLFEVELQIGTQSAWTQSIPIYIKFRSTIDADNVQISWDVPAGLKYKMNHPQFISVKKGEVYTYQMTLEPEAAGTYNIGGNVTQWQFNTNYTSAGNITVKVGQDLLTDPLTSGYTGAVILKYIVIALLVLLAGVGIYFGWKKVLELLKEWLKPPE